jgi:hypothetical protein
MSLGFFSATPQVDRFAYLECVTRGSTR